MEKYIVVVTEKTMCLPSYNGILNNKIYADIVSAQKDIDKAKEREKPSKFYFYEVVLINA
jgi:hypothetical protein